MDTVRYEKLIDLIQASNPDILALKFGCAVSGQGIDRGLIIDRTVPATTVRVEVGNYKVEEISKADWLHTMKILGRSIRLADIYMAMKTVYYDRWGKLSSMNADVQWRLRTDFLKINALYHHSTDDLENQSPEFKQLLTDLLIPKV